MKYFTYFIFLLALYSCDRKSNNNLDCVQNNDSLNMDSIVKEVELSSTTPFLNNSLFSYNATGLDKFEDTIYAYEIDTFLKNYPSDGSTFGDMKSYYQATEKLDKMIEEVYKKIYKKLKNKQDKKLFKISHDNWKRYFESEATFLHEIYYTKEIEYGFGREHSVTQAQWVFQIARQRLILLKNIDEQTYTNNYN
jgi:alpha-L-arabinofuranosidase